MIDPKQREQLHKILDLVFDINKYEGKARDNLPKTFFWFCGHCNSVIVDVHLNGWNPEKNPDISFDKSIGKDYIGDTSLDEMIALLGRAKEGLTTVCTQCGETCADDADTHG